jgi:hypothetical protein
MLGKSPDEKSYIDAYIVDAYIEGIYNHMHRKAKDAAKLVRMPKLVCYFLG